MKRDAILLAVTLAVIFGLRFLSAGLKHEESTASSLAYWPQLMHTKIHTDYAHGLYSADIPDDVKLLAGKEITIGGYMMPLEPFAKSPHFLLSRRTPSCPFCPPGEPNEIIDVETETPMPWLEDRIIVTGIFELMDDRKAGLFFHLTKARVGR